MANAIGKSKSTIGRIEAGITVPRVATLLAIAQVLHIVFSLGEASTDNNDKVSL
ncbi:helix-turn-helix domain-containing protein [Marinococcus halophilus]|uniref:helix-turn-helix domain-containing protein n=1 Tax=Marinococcus halophilus TaxID=1371 RepID=UPI0009A78EE5